MGFPEAYDRAFNVWVASGRCPQPAPVALREFDGTAHEHLFAAMTLYVSQDFSAAAKHLRMAVKKNKLQMACAGEVAVINAACLLHGGKSLAAILQSGGDALEGVLRKHYDHTHTPREDHCSP